MAPALILSPPPIVKKKRDLHLSVAVGVRNFALL